MNTCKAVECNVERMTAWRWVVLSICWESYWHFQHSSPIFSRYFSDIFPIFYFTFRYFSDIFPIFSFCFPIFFRYFSDIFNLLSRYFPDIFPIFSRYSETLSDIFPIFFRYLILLGFFGWFCVTPDTNWFITTPWMLFIPAAGRFSKETTVVSATRH